MATVSVSQIAALLKVLETATKLELDTATEKKYGELLKRLKTKAHDLNEKTTSVEDYEKLLEGVKKTVAEVVKAVAEAKKNKGYTFCWKGETDKTEDEAVAFIKKHLPANGHGNISQAMSDVVLGRGKSTPKASGVLHASSGISDLKRQGCTLFFKRKDDEIEIIAIGQHDKVERGQDPKYFIHWAGATPFKADTVYEF